jgi:menaquinone-dependent protoporphyrinogen IX oxidase
MLRDTLRAHRVAYLAGSLRAARFHFAGQFAVRLLSTAWAKKSFSRLAVRR